MLFHVKSAFDKAINLIFKGLVDIKVKVRTRGIGGSKKCMRKM